ncbi:MAG: citrate lyase holo-[acyl-carrier protein] synthase [Clostridiales bacterium]|nr:citrate lyase holo-[acyl-carrier protein] synthase [Clostridiales bacterium]
MEYIAISLPEIMEHREKRTMRTAELIRKHQSTVVCMSMNFIGEYKVLKHSRLIFNMFCEKVLRSTQVRFHEVEYSTFGDYAHFVCEENPEAVKAKMCKLEESCEVGRLFDIDVYYGMENDSPAKISREGLRKCLICDKPAIECSRSRAHGIEAVRSHSIDIMKRHLATLISECAYDSLISEVETTPKPGLVDKNNNGSHTDMNINSFYASSLAIKPFYYDMALETFKSFDNNLSIFELMRRLQAIGRAAETAMMSATIGINTQLGAIYTIGLLSCGVVMSLEHSQCFDAIPNYAQSLVLSVKVGDIPSFGARFEAENAFPNILATTRRIQILNNEHNFNNSCVFALLEIMLLIDDTNVLRRGGESGLIFVREQAKRILEFNYSNEMLKAVLDFDNEMIRRNLSPGGCADILAAAIFMLNIKQRIFEYGYTQK